MSADKPSRKNPNFRPTDDFASAYANHAFIEPSEWDLKIIFGQLDQSVDPNVVDQHTAITMPWNQAKILYHFLRVQLAAFELTHGTIPLAQGILPPEVPSMTEEIKKEPKSQEIYEMLKRARNELVEGKPLA